MVSGSSIDYSISTLSLTDDDTYLHSGNIWLYYYQYVYSDEYVHKSMVNQIINSDTAFTNNDVYNDVITSSDTVSSIKYHDYLVVTTISQDDPMFYYGDSFTLRFVNCLNYFEDDTTKEIYKFDPTKIKRINLDVTATDGTRFSIEPDDYDFQVYGETMSVELSVYDVPCDVYRIAFSWVVYISDLGVPTDYTGTLNKYYGFQDAELRLAGYEAKDETSGFLATIIDWLSSIKDGITSVGDGIKNVTKSITELPSKIWNLIETGLKNLFVPTQEDIQQMSTDWENLMRDKFGALYQSADIVHDFAETLQNGSTESGGVITMPETTVNLAGVNYTFGGFDVDLIPNGFEFLANSIKTIISIICTIAFINALKTKLEGLMK